MPKVELKLESPVARTFRVDKVAGTFDVSLQDKSRLELSVHVPPTGGEGGDWRVGAIIGPSGAGKSQVARQAYGEAFVEPDQGEWPRDAAIVDGFAAELDMRTITGTLSAVGFSSPPAWVLPYAALSTGQRMRADLARALLRQGEVVAFDEFTSVVDRQVAAATSVAVAKAVRRRHVPVERFVAVSCHYDVIDWLEPDWVLDMSDRRLIVSPAMKLDGGELAKLPRGSLRRRAQPWRRPTMRVEVRRVRGARHWPVFCAHHYLSHKLHPASRCYAAMFRGEPIAFIATLPNAGHRGRRIVHRLVVLPDYQGLGVGLRLLDAVVALEAAAGYRMSIRTSHPGLIAALRRGGRCGLWGLSAIERGDKPHKGFIRKEGRHVGSVGRLTATFRYEPGD